jgi:hypothetical protein
MNGFSNCGQMAVVEFLTRIAPPFGSLHVKLTGEDSQAFLRYQEFLIPYGSPVSGQHSVHIP